MKKIEVGIVAVVIIFIMLSGCPRDNCGNEECEGKENWYTCKADCNTKSCHILADPYDINSGGYFTVQVSYHIPDIPDFYDFNVMSLNCDEEDVIWFYTGQSYKGVEQDEHGNSYASGYKRYSCGPYKVPGLHIVNQAKGVLLTTDGNYTGATTVNCTGHSTVLVN